MSDQIYTNNSPGHKIVSRQEWLSARKELLKEEKELTYKSDELAKKRRELPWVKIEKDYTFETEQGALSLAKLFQGRSQLIIYHFMFGPDYLVGCPSCSSIADSFEGVYTHLANHDVMFWSISGAPLAKLLAYKKRMEWTFPWASSVGSDFNFDFHVSFTNEQQQSGNTEYNYETGDVSSNDNNIKKDEAVPESGKKLAASVGLDWAAYTKEAPGMSVFILHEGDVYHTYSAYASGLDVLWNMYQWLDRVPLGRNEKGTWIQRHDEYKDPNPDTENPGCCCHK